MSQRITETTAWAGQLFRVREVAQPDRPGGQPYEFVDRIGAVTVLPIVNQDGKPHVLAIKNTRAHYGTSFGLPGGHRDGGFEDPEPFAATGLRELAEETGHGYPAGTPANVDVFTLRRISATIRYPRGFMVARNVVEVGGQHDNPREQIRPMLVPLDEYVDPLLAGTRTDLHPEVNLAFMRAGMLHGHDAVLDWLRDGADSPHASAIVSGFAPWITPLSPGQ